MPAGHGFNGGVATLERPGPTGEGSEMSWVKAEALRVSDRVITATDSVRVMLSETL